MHSTIQESLLGGYEWNEYIQPENMLVYQGDQWAVPGTDMSIEVLSYDANLAHQEKATAMSHFNSSAMPIDIHPVASMDSPYTSLSPTAITQDILASSSSSSSLDSSWSDPTPYDDQVFSSIPNVAGQGHSYPTCMSQKSWDDWQRSVSQSWGPGSDGKFGTPPGLGVNASTTYVRLGQGDHGDIYWDSFPQHTGPKRQKCERPAVQLLGQGGSDRRFTCPVENCGKSFSGEWEKTRHINSIHRPPTIGCRECNYKQSRKDLFSEHCRKRHPGRSVDDMMIQLDTPSE